MRLEAQQSFEFSAFKAPSAANDEYRGGEQAWEKRVSAKKRREDNAMQAHVRDPLFTFVYRLNIKLDFFF